MPWHKSCINNKKIRVIIAISLILSIASFFRFWQLDETPPGLYHDEAMNVNQAREAWREGNFKIFYPENNGREGLFITIQALSLAAFGNTPFAARLPSALFGILTVFGVFFLTKELFDINPKHEAPYSSQEIIRGEVLNSKQYPNSNIKNTKPFGILNLFRIWDLGFGISRGESLGLISSFLLAASFWHINFSRIGFRAIMAPFFLVWSMYFLWKLINGWQTKNVIATPRSGGGNPIENSGIAEPIPSEARDLAPRNDALRSTLYAVIGGLLFGLGFHSYIAYRIAPLLLIIPFIVGWQIYKSSPFSSRYIDISIFRMRSNCLPCLLALFLFFTFIAALPLGMYFLEHHADFIGRSAQVSIFSSQTPLYDLGKNILTTMGMFFWHGDYNWRHNFSGSSQLWWPVSILFLIGFIVSIRVLIQKSKLKNIFTAPEAFLLSWLVAFQFPVIFSNESLPHALRALPLVIPAVIFAAIGLEWIINNVLQWLERKRGESPNAVLQLNRIQRELFIFLFVFFAAIAMHSFNQYFLRWMNNPRVYAAFNGSYADLGRYLANLPSPTKKYIIINTSGHMLADNIPMPAQTVMFFTDTWNKQKRDKKNFVYIPSADELSSLPRTLSSPSVIAMLENDPALRRELKTRYPELISKITSGGLILTNVE